MYKSMNKIINDDPLDLLYDVLKISPLSDYITIKLDYKLLIVENNNQENTVAGISYLTNISKYQLEYTFASNTLFFHFSKPDEIIKALSMLNSNLYEIIDFNV